MASGFDDVKNGIGLGAVFGALVAYVALMPTAASWISWLGTLLNNASSWFVAQTWWPVSISSTVAAYSLAIIVGAILGGWIDKK